MLNGHAPAFRKYCLPSGAAAGASRGDHFAQPGIGGNSTFVVMQPGAYIARGKLQLSGDMPPGRVSASAYDRLVPLKRERCLDRVGGGLERLFAP
jgi:hypothetical protein